MLTHVPRAIFLAYFSTFAPWCDSFIVDHSSLSTVGNVGYELSVSKNTILRETGEVSVTESSDVPTLYSQSCCDNCVTWSDFVFRVDNDWGIKYESVSEECGTVEGLVGVSGSEITAQLENGKAWQPSGEPWYCEFYLYRRAFPVTWDAGMQWWL